MATLDDLFREYLHRVQPDKNAVKRASKAHKPLREELEKDESYGPHVAKTMLSGSYGRGTATFYIKDVDVILQTTFTRELLQAEKRDDETEQHCLLQLTQDAIRRTGRAARTRKARRSIHVTLPEELNDLGETVPELTMDIVPVLLQYGEDVDPMTIADRELEEWYDTYPATQLEDSRTRNENSAEIGDRHSYKPLVKIFKAWKKVHYDLQKTPKGFILECLTGSYHNPWAIHWIDAVHDLFANICLAWPDPDNLDDIPKVPDISDSSPHMIPIAKTVDEAQDVLTTIHNHLALIEQAMEEAETDLTQSAQTLQRVFGEDCDDICFPLQEDLDEPENGGSKGRSSPFKQSRSDVREAPEFG